MAKPEHQMPAGLVPPHGSKRTKDVTHQRESEEAAAAPGPHPSAHRIKHAAPPEETKKQAKSK
jgi:hypothetical protein